MGSAASTRIRKDQWRVRQRKKCAEIGDDPVGMAEHRSEFTPEEADEILHLLREVRRADRSRQKGLRARLRRIGFYITDYVHDQAGFTASDFDDLVRRGVVKITVVEGRGKARPSGGGGSSSAAGAINEPVGASGRETEPVVSADGLAWYEDLRQRYRPNELRILLIAESPPDPAAGDRRFFYAPNLAQADNLYRGVAEAVYGLEPGYSVTDKPAVLDRLQSDGYWLIDAVEHPINRTSSASRKAAIRAAVPELVERCHQLAPVDGVIVCHGGVYGAVAPALRAAKVRILHDEPLPFPLGNWRRQFVEGFRSALAEI